VLIITVCFTRAALGALTLSGMFSDHAVLQADQPIPVWGQAEAGAKVTVKFADKSADATADEKGNWRATLAAMPATNKAGELVVSSGNESKTLTDILVGEVWLGSGQSNMVLSLGKTDNAEQFIAKADFPQIRLFKVATAPAADETSGLKGTWVVCSPKSVPLFSAALYHFGRDIHEQLHVPVGLIESCVGGTPIQTWMPRDTLGPSPATQVNPKGDAKPSLQPAHLFNGMIAPIIPYAIRGVLWYQGENNVHQNDQLQYAENMKKMVDAWRSRWREGDFPFFYVQIAPYGKYRSEKRTALAEMWEQQSKALGMIRNSAIAPISDIGNIEDIHPKNKAEVGRRLALIAFAKVYGMHDTVFEGPMYKSHEIEGNAIRVHFNGVGSGLASRDGKALTNFEIAGADGNFVPADAKIDGNDVVVSSEKVKSPTALHFAWDESAVPNLMNKEGLPAIAFRIPQPDTH
jgi:sialate O-acetylesterase